MGNAETQQVAAGSNGTAVSARPMTAEDTCAYLRKLARIDSDKTLAGPAEKARLQICLMAVFGSSRLFWTAFLDATFDLTRTKHLTSGQVRAVDLWAGVTSSWVGEGQQRYRHFRPNPDAVAEAKAILITYGSLWFETIVG